MHLLWDGPRRLLELAPRWLVGVLGILVLGLGGLLVPRPLTSATALCLWGAFSLALTGVLTLVGSRRGQTSPRGRRWITIFLSTAWILVGGAVVIRLGRP